ncbi:hypothetical protein B0T25DRAFT_310110 [Lasiosphaeria hispida]|uniref:Uncharacterized protein n=1 Tax=Lasiosphaeria hispida TaxID=260671 RepID=A0AAJ0M9C8_9PEZI|nr:hypothetical protein B0T25DRAFT_310110 [Lasiosphaeria hispida]
MRDIGPTADEAIEVMPLSRLSPGHLDRPARNQNISTASWSTANLVLVRLTHEPLRLPRNRPRQKRLRQGKKLRIIGFKAASWCLALLDQACGENDPHCGAQSGSLVVSISTAPPLLPTCTKPDDRWAGDAHHATVQGRWWSMLLHLLHPRRSAAYRCTLLPLHDDMAVSLTITGRQGARRDSKLPAPVESNAGSSQPVRAGLEQTMYDLRRLAGGVRDHAHTQYVGRTPHTTAVLRAAYNTGQRQAQCGANVPPDPFPDNCFGRGGAAPFKLISFALPPLRVLRASLLPDLGVTKDLHSTCVHFMFCYATKRPGRVPKWK